MCLCVALLTSDCCLSVFCVSVCDYIYVGGELVLETVARDIRYQPLEFDGWLTRYVRVYVYICVYMCADVCACM